MRAGSACAFKARKYEGCSWVCDGRESKTHTIRRQRDASLEDLQYLGTGLEAREERGVGAVGEVRGCGLGPGGRARARVSRPGAVKSTDSRKKRRYLFM